MMDKELKSCPYCGDKMRKCPTVMNKPNIIDGVKHIVRNNNCPVGVGIYKIDIWNDRTAGQTPCIELLKEIQWQCSQNPYSEKVFTMTIEAYKKAIPDEKLRTAISGCLGREFWNIATKKIGEMIDEFLKEDTRIDTKAPCHSCGRETDNKISLCSNCREDIWGK